MPPPTTRKPPETRGIGTTPGASPRTPRPATADHRLKGSDHDNHADEPEDSRDSGNARPDTPDGDRADGPQDADESDADAPRHAGQGAAVRSAERAVEGSVLSGRDREWIRASVRALPPATDEEITGWCDVISHARTRRRPR